MPTPSWSSERTRTRTRRCWPPGSPASSASARPPVRGEAEARARPTTPTAPEEQRCSPYPTDAPRREVAKQFGATHTVDPTATDLEEYVRDLTDGLGAHVVVICIGHPGLVQQAMQVVRKSGAVNAFAGFSKASLAEVDPNLIHYGELRITGASNASRASHKKALRLIGEGKIDVKSLHTHTFALDDVVEGIEFAQTGQGIKIAISPDGK